MNNDVTADKVSSAKLGRILTVCAGLLIILALLASASFVVASFLMPRRYFSKVTMELPLEAPSTFGAAGSTGAYDREHVQRQLAILQKTEILYPVIQRLDLTRAYASPGTTVSQAEAYQRLRASMKLQEVRNTGLVEIGIFDTDPQRAANIANTIAVVYQDMKSQDDIGSTEAARKQLDSAVEEQRQRTEEASRVAMEIRARHGIADPDPEKESAVLSFAGNGPDAIAAKAKMTEYVDAKQRAIHARKVLESMALAVAQEKITKAAAEAQSRGKIWEKAERAEQPENRIAGLIDRVLH